MVNSERRVATKRTWRNGEETVTGALVPVMSGAVQTTTVALVALVGLTDHERKPNVRRTSRLLTEESDRGSNPQPSCCEAGPGQKCPKVWDLLELFGPFLVILQSKAKLNPPNVPFYFRFKGGTKGNVPCHAKLLS